MGDAAALLFATGWPEPFDLAQIGPTAIGTSVIAACRGAALEIVEAGVAGFVGDGIEEAVTALPAAHRPDRATIRRRFDACPRAVRMTRDRLALCGDGLSRGAPEPDPRAAAGAGDS